MRHPHKENVNGGLNKVGRVKIQYFSNGQHRKASTIFLFIYICVRLQMALWHQVFSKRAFSFLFTLQLAFPSRGSLP